MDQRRESESGVGDPPRHHDLRPLRQRFDHGFGSEIHVGRQKRRFFIPSHLPCFHVLEGMSVVKKLIQPRQDVVAIDHGDVQSGNAEACCGGMDGGHARSGIHSAGVRHHFDLARRDVGKQLSDHRHEIQRIAVIRVSGFLFLQDGHGDFRQVIHHQVIDGAIADLPDRCDRKVAPEALSRSDSDWVLSHNGKYR